MKIKLKVSVILPYGDKKLEKGSVLEVVERKGQFYVCQNDEVDCIYIQENDCEVIE